jgi:putative phage-type endonuclease
MSMIIFQLQQGTAPWHKFRAEHLTASDASAMLGTSKYKTRTALLHEKKTGIVPEVTPMMQSLFDKGHLTEAMARLIVEEKMGDEFFPVTGTSSKRTEIAASLDGMTFCESILFEHKLWNLKLAQFMTQFNDLPDTHWPQVEQQLYVSGAGTCVFVVSDGTEDNWVQVEYHSRPERLKEVLDGWAQFEKDLITYEPKEVVVQAVGEVVRDLPAIRYDLDKTSLALTSNISQFKDAALALVERSKEPMESDQDFADADMRVKAFKKAEISIDALAESVQGEIQDVDTFVKDLREIKESIRQARLAQDKQVKARKESIKFDMVANAGIAFTQFIQELNLTTAPVRVPCVVERSYFADAIKGKKNLDSMQSAIDDSIAKAKITANQWAEKIRANLVIFNDQTAAYEFLFADKAEIVLKDAEDLSAIIKARISEHQEMLVQQEEQKLRDQAKAEEQAIWLADQEAALKKTQDAALAAQQSRTIEVGVALKTSPAIPLQISPAIESAAPATHQRPIFVNADLSHPITNHEEMKSLEYFFGEEELYDLVADRDAGIKYELEVTVRRVAIKNQKAA